MRYKEKYTNLQTTVNAIGTQIADSIPFAQTWLPGGSMTPSQLFWLLRQNTTYKNDPPGIELLQSMPSLFEDNYWGIPGAGDCDCFTITAAACCIDKHIPCRLAIVGNGKLPTHIYLEVKDNGSWVPFDLVNPNYGEVKKYKYISRVKIK